MNKNTLKNNMRELNILVAGSGGNSLANLAEALAEIEALSVSVVESATQVFAEIGTGRTDVVIVDEEVEGMSGLECIREVVRRNPFINCALVSQLYPDEFHKATEGLGVFLLLPWSPGKEEAEKIYSHLVKIYQLVPGQRRQEG